MSKTKPYYTRIPNIQTSVLLNSGFSIIRKYKYCTVRLCITKPVLIVVIVNIPEAADNLSSKTGFYCLMASSVLAVYEMKLNRISLF